MRLDLRLDSPAACAMSIIAMIGLCVCLVYVVLCDFLVGALTGGIAVTADASLASFIWDPFTGEGANPAALTVAGRYIPNSPRLHLKLADFERSRSNNNADISAAELDSIRAAQLSPHDYRPRLLLAAIQDSKGDRAAAERSLRATLQLAPRNAGAHYFLGTLLLVRGSFQESFQELRTAISGYPEYLNRSLNMVWSETHENAAALHAITPDNPKDLLALSRFLLEQSQPLESAAVFREIDRNALLGDRESAQYLNRLIAAGHVKLAHDLWRGLVGHEAEAVEETAGIWNSGFENDIFVDFAQFDWSLQSSQYAAVSLDTQIARTGK